MNKLKLTKKERAEVHDLILENMIDAGKNDTWHFDKGMTKLMEYLGVKVPQDIPVTTYGADFIDHYEIKLRGKR